VVCISYSYCLYHIILFNARLNAFRRESLLYDNLSVVLSGFPNRTCLADSSSVGACEVTCDVYIHLICSSAQLLSILGHIRNNITHKSTHNEQNFT
jgi:hypothetical protein